MLNVTGDMVTVNAKKLAPYLCSRSRKGVQKAGSVWQSKNQYWIVAQDRFKTAEKVGVLAHRG